MAYNFGEFLKLEQSCFLYTELIEIAWTVEDSSRNKLKSSRKAISSQVRFKSKLSIFLLFSKAFYCLSMQQHL